MSKDRLSFYYNLRTQYENLGDLVINRECISLLKEHGDVLVNTACVPEFFVEGLRLSPNEICADNRSFQDQILKSGSRSFLVLVPGALPSTLRWKDFPRQLLLVLHFKLLALRGVKIIRVGVSIDDLSPLRRFVEKLKSRSMAFLGPRDSASLFRARRFGMKNLLPFQDFAFLLPAVEKSSRADDTIVVSFRAHNNTEISEILSVLDQAVAQIDPGRLRKMVFVSQVDQDRICAERFIAHFGMGREIFHVDHSEGIDKVFAVYDHAACVFSNRLHVLLFALSRGAPIWAMVHPARNAKIVGLFEDVGLGDRLIRLTENVSALTITNLLEPVDPALFGHAGANLRAQFAKVVAF